MAKWVKMVADVGVGGAGGAFDQLIQNADEKREAEAGVKLPVMRQFGSYYNYGFPIVSILAVALGGLKGDWATRLVTLGSALAGRKIAWQATKRRVVAWTSWQRTQAAQAAAKRAQVSGPASEVGIPVIADETVLV